MTTPHNLRKVLKDLPFDFWVRKWRDGELWVNSVDPSQYRADVIAEKLTSAGYKIVRRGKTGTSGEFIIEVHENV